MILFKRNKEGQHLTLEKLADKKQTYWKFSQSIPGLSSEPKIFALYKEKEYTIAQDPDKLLSFVTDKDICNCYMYGDQLIKFCFDKTNPKFRKIQNLPYRFIEGSLGEYETSCLLVEKIYSLKYKNTIKLLVSMLPNNNNRPLLNWFYNSPSFEQKLLKYGFTESAELISQIRTKEIYKKIDLLTFIDSYKTV